MIVAAVIIAILAFLLFSPTYIVMQYTEQKFTVYIRLWFLVKIRLLKDKTSESASEKAKKQPKREKTKVHYTISERLEQLGIVFRLVVDLLKQFCKHFTLYRCKLCINISGEDPADVATEFGLANAAGYGIISFLNEKIKIRKKEINISCDYNNEESQLEADLRFRVMLLKFVLVLICTNIRDIMALLRSVSKPQEIHQEVK